jgi:hypothetical protein
MRAAPDIREAPGIRRQRATRVTSPGEAAKSLDTRATPSLVPLRATGLRPRPGGRILTTDFSHGRARWTTYLMTAISELL